MQTKQATHHNDKRFSPLWPDTAATPAFPRLHGDIRTDVLIIGGGMAGFLCAYMLEQAGADYALAEAGRLGGGVTGRTTAKITSQHGLIYGGLIKRFGLERARMYLEANETAIAQYRALCADRDCDFEERDAFVYSLDDRGKLDRELAALARLGFPATFTEEPPLPFPTAGAIGFRRQAQFHPLKFMAALAKGLRIYEHTPVRELIGTTAVTDGGRIRASRIIVATHFPFINKHGGYFMKLYQDRSYVLALRGAPAAEGMFVDEAGCGPSLRDHRDLLLLGGGSHRTGKAGGAWRTLEGWRRQWYPDAAEAYRWATQDCMTLDGVPYIGPYAPAAKGLYVAAGFNKWGMSSAMVSAMILTDMMQGKPNAYAPVFNPSRSMLRPQLAVNALESIVGLLTPSKKRCPHLGCALKWNPQERSWDCPCHGSRFSERGKLIENPATGDLPERK